MKRNKKITNIKQKVQIKIFTSTTKSDSTSAHTNLYSNNKIVKTNWRTFMYRAQTRCTIN